MGPSTGQFNGGIPSASTAGNEVDEAAAQLARFLGALAHRHVDRDRVFALRLAEAGLASLSTPPLPAPALAVIGPTQTGKSTMVNLILGGEFVETSPLAAHTREAGLLAVNTPAAGIPAAGTGGLEVAPREVEADCPSCLVWDTPDFDSNAADAYRQQVARVCAVSDLVVVVVTREKYADQSVWRILETIAPLGIPTVICLNKSDAEADGLVPVIRRRLEEQPVTPAGTPVATVPGLTADGPWSSEEQASVRAFRALVFDRLALRPTEARRAGLARLARRHWTDWTAPVEDELACHREWNELVAGQTRAFLARYRSEYIDHARHHDVARKAILGLLELLEIPALAGPMARTRRVLTWPFRRLAGAFGSGADRSGDQELVVLDTAIEHYLLSLRSEALGRHGAWWRALSGELTARQPALRREFMGAVEDYRAAFQPRIDDLSRELYEQLRDNPVTLNTLRAARVSADAGGIVLAVKTGALGLYDALFAPAVVSLTSYLTESVVGQYLRAVIGRLKREQVDEVTRIIRDEVEAPLLALRPTGPGLFGVTRAELDEARRRLEMLES